MDNDQKLEILHHNFKIEDDKIDNQWKSCCLITDKRAVLFFSQYIIMLIIVIFCVVQLILSPDCNSQRAYSALLTLIIGIIVPQPSIKK